MNDVTQNVTGATARVKLSEAVTFPRDFANPEGPAKMYKAGEEVEVPYARALQLISSKQAKLAAIPMRLERSYRMFNPGEDASFSPKEAKFLEERGIAKRLTETQKTAYPKDHSPSDSTPSDSARHWKAVVKAINAESDPEKIMALADHDGRPAVRKAAESRLGELAGDL